MLGRIQDGPHAETKRPQASPCQANAPAEAMQMAELTATFSLTKHATHIGLLRGGKGGCYMGIVWGAGGVARWAC